jgi:hypothetical protein
MTKPTDDLEAVRVIAEALQGFPKEEQERIIRWSREKVGLSASGQITHPDTVGKSMAAVLTQPPGVSGTIDIKSFLDEKNPKSDNQLAAAVAYYYRFHVPEGKRKEEIGAEDLQDACRLAGRDRLKNPGQTLINALNQGLIDKGAERGKYSINTVGENLVAMVLPGSQAVSKKRKKKKTTKRS